MTDFTVKKVNLFPSTGVPSAMYTKKESTDHFSIKMATKDGSKLLKLICEDKLIIYSSLTVTGAPAAKFSTLNELTFNTDPADNITSYTVSVNGSVPIVVTDPNFSLLMSDQIGVIMTAVVTPRDDIGTNFYPVEFSSLTTAGPPIDSGLTVDGPTELELEASGDLILNNYISDIDRIDYTVGLSSLLTVDPAQSAPKTVTVSPIGDEGQIIPITFYPETDDFNEYLPVLHYIRLIAKQPIDGGVNLTGATDAPLNIPYHLSLNTSNPDITGYTVYADTDPQIEWTFDESDPNWNMDLNDLPVGRVVIITAIPNDGTDQPYVPVNYSFTVEGPVITSSGVILSGSNSVHSGEPYALGITNNNADISSYEITFNGDDPVVVIGNPDEWIKTRVDHVIGDSIDIVVVPLSDTSNVYSPVTKTINVLARNPEEDGISYVGPSEVNKDDTYVEGIDTSNIHPKVDGIRVYYDDVLQTTLPPTTTGWDKLVSVGNVGDIKEVRHEPFSNDPNYLFNSTTLSFVIIEPEPIDSGMTLTGDQNVYAGNSVTFNWVYDNPDVTSVILSHNGTVVGIRTNTAFTTPAVVGNVGDVFTVTIEPISDSYKKYIPITEDYVIVESPAPVESGIEWETDNTVGVLEPITFIRQGNIPADLDYQEIWLNGSLVATLGPDEDQFVYANNDTSTTPTELFTFTFKQFSTIPNRTFIDTDVAVGIVESSMIDNAALDKTGLSTINPTGTIKWTFTYTGKDIESVDVTGDHIEQVVGADPDNVIITVTDELPLNTIMTLYVVAHTTDGKVTAPAKEYSLRVSMYVTGWAWLSTADQMKSVIAGDELLTWVTPYITTQNTGYDSIRQEVRVAPNDSFNPGETSNFNFPVTTTTQPMHNLPLMVGELNLDKELPATGTIYISSRYVFIHNGEEFPNLWTPPTHHSIQDLAELRLITLPVADTNQPSTTVLSVPSVKIDLEDRNLDYYFDGDILRFAKQDTLVEAEVYESALSNNTFMDRVANMDGAGSVPFTHAGSLTHVSGDLCLATSFNNWICSYNWKSTPMTKKFTNIGTLPPEMSSPSGNLGRATHIRPLMKDSGQVVCWYTEPVSHQKLVRIEQLTKTGDKLTPITNIKLYSSSANVVNVATAESGNYVGWSDEFEQAWIYKVTNNEPTAGLTVYANDGSEIIIGMYMKYDILAVITKHRYNETIRMDIWDLETKTFSATIDGDMGVPDNVIYIRNAAPDNSMVQTGVVANILHEDIFSVFVNKDSTSEHNIYRFDEVARSVVLHNTVNVAIDSDRINAVLLPIVSPTKTEYVTLSSDNVTSDPKATYHFTP